MSSDFKQHQAQQELKKSTICEHLRQLETDLIKQSYRINSRGKAWEKVREWVYFDCYLDRASIEAVYNFPDFVIFHEHLGTHDGREAGFSCELCGDGVMGVHAKDQARYPVFIAQRPEA